MDWSILEESLSIPVCKFIEPCSVIMIKMNNSNHSSGKLYWTDWNRKAPKIESSNLDGSKRTVLIDSGLDMPNNLIVDYDHDDLCWTNTGLNRIECMNLYSKSRRVIFSQASKLAFPFKVRQFYMFFTSRLPIRFDHIEKQNILD